MENPNYHGEITTISPDRRQTLSVDIMLRWYKTGTGSVVSLSVWNEPDDYDPSAVIDLSPADARRIAEHLRVAADVLACQAATPDEPEGNDRALSPTEHEV
jgi:hypothetical protein